MSCRDDNKVRMKGDGGRGLNESRCFIVLLLLLLLLFSFYLYLRITTVTGDRRYFHEPEVREG